MMKVVADDKIPFLKGTLEPYCEVLYLPGSKTTPADVRDADALITRTRTKCKAALLDDSQVKFIATATIGFDHLDTAYLDAHSIQWTNAPGCNSSSVAQYLTSALLNLAVKHHFELAGKTLGIIGVGNVGSKVARVGRALGMKVLLNDPPRAAREGTAAFTELADLLAQADIVTTHVPLEEDTFHLANTAFFAQMRPGSYYINSSRGEVCCPEDLKAALRSGHLAGAILDVWENEPEPDPELMAAVDFATPHIAGYSTDGKANGTSMSVQALSRRFGLPLADWYPNNVPAPPQPMIEVEESGNFEADLLKIVSRSYDIADDTARLRQSPETFEKQRGDYPLRREFPAYTVRGARSARLCRALDELGFKQ